MHWGKNVLNVSQTRKEKPVLQRRLGLSLGCFKADCSRFSESNTESSSYSLDLVSYHHGVLLANLGSSFSFVVVWTVVLIGVTVESTEQVPTAAVKTWRQRTD